MSGVAESRGRETRGNASRNQGGGTNSNPNAGGGTGQGSNENFSNGGGQHASPQDFNWRVGQQQQMEAYSNFYYQGAGYSPFSGDIRDSIAAIWSRTSPSGEGFAAASGGYGQGEGFAAAAAGQFAANLNFAPTSELSMFGAAAASDYSAYGQYGFGPQYTQWPDNGAAGQGQSSKNYSYLSGAGNSAGGRNDLMDVQHGLESMKINRKDSNGGPNGKGPGGKMSWASVASQPAKPTPQPKSAKKPGVLPPPTIIPSTTKAPPAPQQTPSEKMTGPPPSMPSGPPPPNGPPPPHPPNSNPTPILMQNVPPPNMPTVMNNHDHHGGFQRPPPNMQQQPPLQMQQPQQPHPPQQQPPRTHIMNPPRVKDRQQNPANNSGSQTNGGNTKPLLNTVSHPVLENLTKANDYNPKSFDLSPKSARYFVIKSFSEDDIHRSIKYEIWCSTDHGNKRLDAAFKAQNNQGPIFLFFSVNGSGHFCGMAEMLSSVDYSNTGSTVWVQDKFKGQFKVKWIYVKDVPNTQLRHIRLENNEGKPVTNSRDTQEVPPEKGKMVLKILHGFKHTTSLFDDFVHYEKKQEEEDIKKKQHSDHREQHREHHHRDHRGDHHGHRNNDRNDRDHHRDEHRPRRNQGHHHQGDRDGHGGGRGGGHHGERRKQQH